MMCSASSLARPVIVVGSGGFATEVIGYLQACLERDSRTRLVGISCDFVPMPHAGTFHGVPFLGGLQRAMQDHPEACFLVAMGKPAYREERSESILRAGRELYTLVHPSAIVAADAELGAGSIVAPFSIVNAGARIGRSCVLNVFCSVGHGALLGDYSVLSPYAALNGDAETGRACFLGTRATIYPRVRIGDRCQIDTHSYAKANVGDQMIITARSEYRVLKNRLEKAP